MSSRFKDEDEGVSIYISVFRIVKQVYGTSEGVIVKGFTTKGQEALSIKSVRKAINERKKRGIFC